VVAEAQEPVAATLVPAGDAAMSLAQETAPERVVPATAADLVKRLTGLARGVGGKLTGQGFQGSRVTFEAFLNLRYVGTDTAIMTVCTAAVETAAAAAAAGGMGSADEEADAAGVSATAGAGAHHFTYAAMHDASPAAGAALLAAVSGAAQRFALAYQREFGFVLRQRDIVVDDVRVRGIAHGNRPDRATLPATTAPLPAPYLVKSVFFEGGRVDTPVYQLASLTHGHRVAGPAMLIDRTSTVVVEPGFVAGVTVHGDVEVVVAGADAAGGTAESKATDSAAKASGTVAAVGEAILDAAAARAAVPADPIQLSIFSHRFMGIAEQMGRVLQRTSISVNMRERLDYSCALFGPDGGLVANAPHIPVHLGAMQDAVRFQMAHWGADLREGDVLVSNHPQLAGGSHLPDITVMTPVFEGGRIVFFVASRGHHADIGGIAPGETATLWGREEGRGDLLHSPPRPPGCVIPQAPCRPCQSSCARRAPPSWPSSWCRAVCSRRRASRSC
jgi:5-oxoprolinase (ATP-hydrolysing)